MVRGDAPELAFDEEGPELSVIEETDAIVRIEERDDVVFLGDTLTERDLEVLARRARRLLQRDLLVDAGRRDEDLRAEARLIAKRVHDLACGERLQEVLRRAPSHEKCVLDDRSEESLARCGELRVEATFFSGGGIGPGPRRGAHRHGSSIKAPSRHLVT